MTSSASPIDRRLYGLLLLKAVALALLLYFFQIGLSPDEAQYWSWAQHLDWGYYSKPPGIAWQIFATTFVFGNSMIAVRLGSLIFGFLLPLVVYKLAKRAELSDKTAFWSAIAMAFSPLGSYLSIAATTDPGSIFFLACAIWAAVSGPRFLLCGLFVGLAALFKWTAFIYWPIVLFFPWMRKKQIWAAIGISLLALLPSVYWNFGHDFATFKHVAAAAKGRSGNLGDFVLAQVAIFSPIYFVILCVSFFKRKKKPAMRLYTAFVGTTALYLLAACFSKMQPNWAIYLFPPGMVLIAWVGSRLWLHVGTYLAILCTLVALSIPAVQQMVPLPYKWNPLRQNMGGHRLELALAKVPEDAFLFADKYQTASLLSYYGERPAYFFNLLGIRKNQFSYWTQMGGEKGKTGYFVLIENKGEETMPWYIKTYTTRLEPYFESVDVAGIYPLFEVAGTPVKFALVLRGKGYNGEQPTDPQTY